MIFAWSCSPIDRQRPGHTANHMSCGFSAAKDGWAISNNTRHGLVEAKTPKHCCLASPDRETYWSKIRRWIVQIFKFWSFLQWKSANNVCKLLHLLPHTKWVVVPQIKVPGAPLEASAVCCMKHHLSLCLSVTISACLLLSRDAHICWFHKPGDGTATLATLISCPLGVVNNCTGLVAVAAPTGTGTEINCWMPPVDTLLPADTGISSCCSGTEPELWVPAARIICGVVDWPSSCDMDGVEFVRIVVKTPEIDTTSEWVSEWVCRV